MFDIWWSNDRLGLVMVIVAGLSIALTAFGTLFLAATPLESSG